MSFTNANLFIYNRPEFCIFFYEFSHLDLFRISCFGFRFYGFIRFYLAILLPSTYFLENNEKIGQ
ncbi:MAG: hypothetical protein D6813_04580 [Calditrichaeota bacterium]|nr:MAG: hypothetical protein D6813_04580 [Calditrichota bacterium]